MAKRKPASKTISLSKGYKPKAPTPPPPTEVTLGEIKNTLNRATDLLITKAADISDGITEISDGMKDGTPVALQRAAIPALNPGRRAGQASCQPGRLSRPMKPLTCPRSPAKQRRPLLCGRARSRNQVMPVHLAVCQPDSIRAGRPCTRRAMRRRHLERPRRPEAPCVAVAGGLGAGRVNKRAKW